jgi:hypothetical protein
MSDALTPRGDGGLTCRHGASIGHRVHEVKGGVPRGSDSTSFIAGSLCVVWGVLDMAAILARLAKRTFTMEIKPEPYARA